IGELLLRLDGGAPPSPRVARPAPTAAPAQKKNPEPAGPVLTAAAPAAQADPVVATIDTEIGDDDDLPRPGKVWSGPSLTTLLNEQRTQAVKQPETIAAAQSNIEPVDPGDLPAVWQAAITILAAQGPVLPSLLTPGKLVSIEDGRAVVRYAPQHDTFVKMLERNGKKDLIRETLSNLLRESVGVKFEVDPDAAETTPATDRGPARPAAAVRAAQAMPPSAPAPPPPQAPAIKLTPELIESLRKEPLVRAFMDELGAQIVKVE
ncbi:MAG TPA: hypothetical protein VK797_12130, partial [Tepidisphaeraceae bacterium]|nr:hypothetical protein [Tepidisphaeraceae bacterium]